MDKQTDPANPWLVPVREAARISGLSVGAIRRMIYARRLPTFKVGVKHFIRVSDLKRIVDAGTRFAL